MSTSIPSAARTQPLLTSEYRSVPVGRGLAMGGLAIPQATFLQPSDVTEPLHIELDEGGRPRRALAFLDINGVDGAAAERLSSALAASTLLVVGTSDRPPPATARPVLEALSCTV